MDQQGVKSKPFSAVNSDFAAEPSPGTWWPVTMRSCRSADAV